MPFTFTYTNISFRLISFRGNVYITFYCPKLNFTSIRGCLHEISFLAYSDILILVSGQSLIITVYITQPEMKLIAVVISLRSFWHELNFISRDKMSCKHYPKLNKIKGNICACLYFIKTKIIGFYSIGRFSQTTPETKFHSILPAMRSNVNRISFMVGWNFISGLM